MAGRAPVRRDGQLRRGLVGRGRPRLPQRPAPPADQRLPGQPPKRPPRRRRLSRPAQQKTPNLTIGGLGIGSGGGYFFTI